MTESLVVIQRRLLFVPVAKEYGFQQVSQACPNRCGGVVYYHKAGKAYACDRCGYIEFEIKPDDIDTV